MAPDPGLELRALRAEVGELRADISALTAVVRRLLPAQRLAPNERRVIEALAAVFGPGTAMTSGEIVAACGLSIGARPELADALVGVAGSLAAHPVGMALRRIAALSADDDVLRLAAPRTESGRRVWCVEAGPQRAPRATLPGKSAAPTIEP